MDSKLKYMENIKLKKSKKIGKSQKFENKNDNKNLLN